MKVVQSAPTGKSYRVSSEASWPLRGVDGLTFAERKMMKEKEDKK